jgi:recombination protein RecA
LDEQLCGGLAAGAITEFVGPQSSGRTSAALAYTAALTQAGCVCAWMDVADSFDPESAAANGVDLERLLWVRCGPHSEKPPLSQVQTVAPPATQPSSQPRSTGGGSPHPRSEGRDMPGAITAMLRAHGGLHDHQLRREKKSIATPGAPNRPLAAQAQNREVRQEQVTSDRLPPRRGENLALAPRCAEPQPRRPATPPSAKRLASVPPLPRERSSASPWKALDQALRATDLLLQAGGFSALILDLGSTPPEIAWRIPLATWFRFRAACDRTCAALLLLTQHPCARSSAETTLRLAPGTLDAQSNVMTAVRFHAATERTRSQSSAHKRESQVLSIRKPPQSARPGQWHAKTPWAKTR